MDGSAAAAFGGHRGGFLRGSDSTMKNRPGIKGKHFLKTTAPTVFTCPHARPRAILFSETTPAKKKAAARRRVKSIVDAAADAACEGNAKKVTLKGDEDLSQSSSAH